MGAYELLHQSGFQRVKADRHQPTANGQQLERLIESALDLTQLVVDEHAQRLEGARRRMFSRLMRSYAARHQRRELDGPLQRVRGARAHDLGGDPIGKTFFAERRNHVTYLIQASVRKPHGYWLAACRVHAHIERTVFVEAEAAFGFVELRGSDAKIEQDSIAIRTRTLRAHDRAEFGELNMHELEPSLARKALAPGRNGLRIPVDRDELPLRPKGLEDARAVTTASECRVDVETDRAQRQGRNHLFDKHRRVLIQFP